MKIFKVLLIIFAVYFIRRFIQFYKAVKQMHDERPKQQSDQFQSKESSASSNDPSKIVDAEFKVIDK